MKRLFVIAALLVLALAACTPKPKIGPLGGVHLHADFKVYLDGKAVDFANGGYMVRAQHVHLEDMNGGVIHVHATGVTFGEFLRTLGMKFTKECFTLDKKYCADGQKTLKFFVNGKPNDLYGDYLIGDRDKLLISYGPKDEDVSQQLASITNYARAQEEAGHEMGAD